MALATWVFIGVILVLVVALVAVKLVEGSPRIPAAALSAAPASVVTTVTRLPPSTFDGAVATGSGPGPTVVGGQAPLEVSGRAEVVFVGDESSPYTAAASWALVAALSRFGTFSHLESTSSPDSEIFGGTPGFGFQASSYHSNEVVFDATERDAATLSSVAPAGYPALQAPGPAVEALLRRYDGGGDANLPFIDVANRLVAVGADIGFSPGLLQGASMSQVAGDMADATSTVGQAVLAVADELTGAVCTADGNRPSAVCTSAGVRAAQEILGLP